MGSPGRCLFQGQQLPQPLVLPSGRWKWLDLVRWDFPASLLLPGILVAPSGWGAGAAFPPPRPSVPHSRIPHRQCLENPEIRGKRE